MSINKIEKKMLVRLTWIFDHIIYKRKNERNIFVKVGQTQYDLLSPFHSVEHGQCVWTSH